MESQPRSLGSIPSTHARRARRALTGVGLALVVCAGVPSAHAASVKVRWLPSTDSRVTGYKVYYRLADTPCANYALNGGAGGSGATVLNVSLPPLESDGTLASVIANLDATKIYRFAVTAYTSDAESAFSSELTFGAVNPCTVDRCYSPSSWDHRQLADGTPCDDSSFCNGAETCSGGVCSNTGPRSCADAVDCTVDTCDDGLARCVHTGPPGCCSACDSGDPCQDSACLAGDCDAPPGDDLNVNRLRLIGLDGAIKLQAKGDFAPAIPIDATITGVSLELLTPDNQIAYQAYIPPSRFKVGDNGNRYRFKATRDELPLVGGLGIVDFRIKQGLWTVTAKGRSTDLMSARSASQLSWVLRLGETCVRHRDMGCDSSRASLAVCR